MRSLLLRSALVLALLFGLLYAVGTALLYKLSLPLSWALGFSFAVVGLQYLLGPFLLEWFFHIDWITPAALGADFEAFLRDHCRQRGLPMPRLGIIEDGNPNAFTFGHLPGNARVVVTRGLVDKLEPEELQAVVAHEMGHVAHYDFLVMALASIVPLVLYNLYQWARRERNQATWVVALGAYAAYVVSQMAVLMLSRIREFFADEHAAESVADANAISRALVKIAYGMAPCPREAAQDKEARKDPAQNPTRVAMAGAMGISDMGSSGAMAMAAAGPEGTFSEARMGAAMRWDLWNPWARWFELFSTHPLVARRVAAASALAASRGQKPLVAHPGPAPEGRVPAFLRDLGMTFLPWIGAALGFTLSGGWALVIESRGFWSTFSDQANLLGWPLILAGLGLGLRLAFSYSGPFGTATVEDLVARWDVSQVKGIPAELEGTIIGRGVPGLFWSQDLVLQDATGFVTVLYRQPFSLLETFFGIFRAKYLIGQQVVVRGWFRRGPGPSLEAAEVRTEDGTWVRCYHRHGQWVLAGLLVILGLWLRI